MKCKLCNEEIPKLSRDRLLEMGYSGFQDCRLRCSVVFCPKHKTKEISDYMAYWILESQKTRRRVRKHER